MYWVTILDLKKIKCTTFWPFDFQEELCVYLFFSVGPNDEYLVEMSQIIPITM